MIKKIIAGVAVVAALVLAGPAGFAQATHPGVVLTAVCNTTTGLNDVTGKVSGDAGYPNVSGIFVSATRMADQIVGKTVKGGQTITVTESIAPNTKSITLKVGIQFDNHKAGDIVYNEGSVRLGDCKRDKPTEPVPFDEPYTSTVGDCTTLTNVTNSGVKQHTFVFNETTWGYDEVVTDVPNPVVTVPFTDEELAVCAGPQPEDKVTYTEWVLGTTVCGDTTRTDTREKTLVRSVRVGAVWVDSEPVKTTETRTVDIEVEECPVVVPPVEPPTPTTPPVTVDENPPAPAKLVTTGTDSGAGWYALGLLAVGAVLLIARRIRTA